MLRLSISGQHVYATTPSAVTLNSSHYSNAACDEEEIFAQDGHIEDIIAVDFATK